MIVSEQVREARKAMQRKRLAMKAKVAEGELEPADYSAYYADQPLQKVKAAKNAEIASARKALKDAREALSVAEITGEGLKAAQEAHAVAALVVHKLDSGQDAGGSSLTAA